MTTCHQVSFLIIFEQHVFLNIFTVHVYIIYIYKYLDIYTCMYTLTVLTRITHTCVYIYTYAFIFFADKYIYIYLYTCFFDIVVEQEAGA